MLRAPALVSGGHSYICLYIHAPLQASPSPHTPQLPCNNINSESMRLHPISLPRSMHLQLIEARLGRRYVSEPDKRTCHRASSPGARCHDARSLEKQIGRAIQQIIRVHVCAALLLLAVPCAFSTGRQRKTVGALSLTTTHRFLELPLRCRTLQLKDS